MKLTRPKKNFYHKFLYRNIDLFLVITKKLYMESCEFLPLDKSKIHILPYGIDKPVIKPSVSKEDSLENIIWTSPNSLLVSFQE